MTSPLHPQMLKQLVTSCGHTVGLVLLPSASVQPEDVSEGAGTGLVSCPLLLHLWDTEVFPLSLFFLPVRASSQCEVSNAGLAPVHPDASVHLPLLGSFPSPESLQDFLCCRISTCIFDKSILKDHCLSSSDGVYFFEKHFTFLAISLNIPFPCISCFVLSHSMIFQYIIVAATSSNAVLVKHVQFSKSAFASFF